MGVALFINIHQHAAVTELVLSKKQLYCMGGGGPSEGQSGEKEMGMGQALHRGLLARRGPHIPAVLWGGGTAGRSLASVGSLYCHIHLLLLLLFLFF